MSDALSPAVLERGAVGRGAGCAGARPSERVAAEDSGSSRPSCDEDGRRTAALPQGPAGGGVHLEPGDVDELPSFAPVLLSLWAVLSEEDNGEREATTCCGRCSATGGGDLLLCGLQAIDSDGDGGDRLPRPERRLGRQTRGGDGCR